VSRDSGAGSADVQPARLGKRLKAFAFDYLTILAYVLVLAAVNYGVILAGGALDRVSPFFALPIGKDTIAFLTLVLPVILYFALQESSPQQATWGKRQVGIVVASVNGERLTRGRALVRSAIKFLPWQIGHTSIYHIKGLPLAPEEPSPMVMAGFVLTYALVGVYVLSALITERYRTPYDWAAGSWVIEA
jgi:uncharacterized RDD family membrane protein YckC